MIKDLSMGTEKKAIDARQIIFFYLPPISYMALIFYMSSKPAPAGLLPEIWNIDKAVHLIEYGILGALWFRALGVGKTNIGRTAIIAWAVTFLYGVSDEIHQYFMPERSCEFFDAMADGIGGWVGVWVYRRWF